ncbi:hypothetical protein [Streptomyces sp. IBSBF 2435]|uniref:hypothetical protein n=1 Tax=Streptomyces sp. IBSBF 2435 TaxID=2903531 RepID=UPI002FDC35DD
MGHLVEVSMRVTGNESDTRLLTAPLEDGRILIGLGGHNEHIDENVAQRWEKIVDLARKALAQPHPLHKWTAIIGEIPGNIGKTPIQLHKPGRVSSMRLRSADNSLLESRATPQRTLHAWKSAMTFPIVVHGSSTAHDWESAQFKAAADLSLLTGLLSLAWDTHISVRESAAPLQWGVRQVPKRIPWTAEESLQAETDDKCDTENVETPTWLEGAWTRMSTRKKIRDALSIYMEGLELEDQHPSLALVSFVSAIEAISLILFKEEKCENCKNQMRIASRFRATVRLVADDSIAAELSRRAYSVRSLTVHTGRLHGSEASPGLHAFRILKPIPGLDFQFRIVTGMRRVAKDLLIWVLREKIPPRRVLEPTPEERMDST